MKLDHLLCATIGFGHCYGAYTATVANVNTRVKAIKGLVWRAECRRCGKVNEKRGDE